MKKFFLILVLVLSCLSLANLTHAQTDEEKMNQLKNLIQQLEQKIQQLNGNIAQTSEQKKTLNNEIANLKKQVSSLQAQIALTEKKIDKTKIEINGVENNIYDTQGKISAQKSSIAQLLLFLNRQDKESLVEILLKNRNIADFLNQQRYTANLTTSLLGLISDLEDTKNDLEIQKNDLQGKKSSLESLNQQQNAQKISLSQVTNSKNQLLTKTKGQEAAYQKLLAETEELQRQANLEVFQLEDKMRRELDPNSFPSARHGILEWPVQGKITQAYGCIESAFARRSYPSCNNKKGGFHNGLDIGAPYGTPLRAAENGMVVAIGNAPYAYGVWAAVEHESGLVTVYTHMSVRSVSVGQSLKRGDVVGNAGSTGLSTGSHIHFMVYAPKTFTTKQSSISGLLPIGATLSPLDYL